ncbi:MAG: SDR family oxidoreductase [Actinobacteria bacterium]|nr:SDR family oxidoreductase [Actinomycetota bacterium]
MSTDGTSPDPGPGPALVTGAASGIGLAVATRLARDGRAVTLVDRDSAGVEAAAATLAAAGAQVLATPCDVTDLQGLRDVVGRAESMYGRLAGVAACAGIEVLGSVLDLAPEEWQRALDVNATGVFNVAKATMASLIDTRGAFVAVASDAGTTGAQGYSAYTASKHAVVGLVRCLALDFGPHGVRSNAVAPAFVETPMAQRIFQDSPEGEADFYRASVPLGRFAMPDEVARAVAHLLSEEASYTNGLVYAIDGGATAGYYRPA